MTVTSTWSVERHRGSAVDFHARPVPEGTSRAVWCFEVDRTAVVLGSTQADEVVDADRLERSGAAVARRRSGGGAVWLAPGGCTWLDLVVARDDPLWEDDVSRSSRWVADTWVRCLTALGVEEPRAHEGGMVETRWSRLVCFAGLAPGEVTVEGRKAVGVAQRRTRHSARFQCALLHRWDPVPLLDVLALDPAERRQGAVDLASSGIGVPVTSSEVLLEAFTASLPD